jgi:hypothetical protein
MQQERFREAREAMDKPENMEAFIARLVHGVTQAFNLIPTGTKTKMPQLNKSETAAANSLAASAFKPLNSDEFKTRPEKYRTGFILGMLIEWYGFIKRQKPSPDEEHTLYSFILPRLGLGNEVNDENKNKLAELLEKLHRFFAASTELPQVEFVEFMHGYNDAKKFYSDFERPLTEVDDRRQINFLVLFIGNIGNRVRSVQELEKFAKAETSLRLQNSPEAFKKSLNLVNWTGAKYSRSMRNKKKVDRAKKQSPVK